MSERIGVLIQRMTQAFPFWVLLFAVWGYVDPARFAGLTPSIVFLLGVVMFGMGLTLSAADFRDVLCRPRDVLVGVLAQYLIMPLLAIGLAKAFRLPPELAVGVILVGACPGGTASNVMTLLARGDVAFSVTLTSVTTLLAPLITPAWVYLLAREWLPVKAYDLFWSVVKMILVPIVMGLVVQAIGKDKVRRSATAVLPFVSTCSIVLIVAAVVAANRETLASTGPLLIAVVILHNVLGYLLGYGVAKLLGFDWKVRKALSIEVGMQNSGLGAALATVHFSPLAAVPSALFSVWHNLSGSLLAAIFRRMDGREGRASAALTPPIREEKKFF